MTLLGASASSSTAAATARQRHMHSSAGSSPGASGACASPTPDSSQSLPLPHSLRPHGVRAHLAEFLPLLPRHALFNIRLTMHQLWNVPLVGGQFSVKWKFQGVKRLRAHHHAHGIGKGKAREIFDVYEHESLTPSGASMLSIPSTSEDSSSAPASPHTTSVNLFPASISANHINLGEGGAGRAGDYDSVEFSQEARGRTPYVALREHNVKWGKTINVVVQMGVHRDTQELQPCELKLVVEQFCKPGDANAPENPQLGAVYLNLAEYVDKGPVSRRYLLRQSKTNATLQLTLDLTHVGGEATYKAPPLQKGEVMAGVATLLEKSAVGSGLGPLSVPRPALRAHRRATDGGSRTSLGMPTGMGMGVGGTRSGRLGSPIPALELGTGGGGRTTDNIIEAIFNPVPTSSPSPSPFTYYVTPKARPIVPPPPLSTNTSDASVSASPQSPGADADTSGNGMEEGRPPSIAPSTTTTMRSERSIATSASRDSTSEREPHRRKWWRKLTSGGGSRAASPQPQPQSPALSNSPVLPAHSNKSSNASVRSSPGLTTRQVPETVAETANVEGWRATGDEEHRSASQIIVGSPTTKGWTLCESRSMGG